MHDKREGGSSGIRKFELYLSIFFWKFVSLSMVFIIGVSVLVFLSDFLDWLKEGRWAFLTNLDVSCRFFKYCSPQTEWKGLAMILDRFFELPFCGTAPIFSFLILMFSGDKIDTLYEEKRNLVDNQ